MWYSSFSVFGLLLATTIRRAAYWLAGGVLLIGGVLPAGAQDQAGHGKPEIQVLKAADKSVDTFVPPTSALVGKRASAPTATINVRYVNFPPNARAAFQLAVDLWETHISSPVPINLTARWVALDESTLGSAGTTCVDADFPTADFQNTWYPVALAEALQERNSTGCENVVGSNADIVANFNSEFDNWYFGTDGNTPSTMYDFTTVVLHEIGHGLGFIGSFTYDDGTTNEGEGNFDECPTQTADVGCWGLGEEDPLPLVFDRFVEDEEEVALLNTQVYPNPSRALGDVLQSNQVFFNASEVLRANEDVPVNLYAPGNFEIGSSFSHLDERAFPEGSINSLMTPQLARGEAIFTPGPVVCGMFRVMGWPLGPDCEALLNAELLAFEAEARQEEAQVFWRIAEDADFAYFVVERSGLIDCQFEACNEQNVGFVPVDTVGATNLREYMLAFEPSFPGRYLLRLRLVRPDESVLISENREVLIPLQEEYALTGVYPNPFRGRTEVNLVLRSSQEVTINVYNILGRKVTVLFDGVVSRRERLRVFFEAEDLPSGIYFIQIAGESFSTTQEVVLIR